MTRKPDLVCSVIFVRAKITHNEAVPRPSWKTLQLKSPRSTTAELFLGVEGELTHYFVLNAVLQARPPVCASAGRAGGASWKDGISLVQLAYAKQAGDFAPAAQVQIAILRAQLKQDLIEKLLTSLVESLQGFIKAGVDNCGVDLRRSRGTPCSVVQEEEAQAVRSARAAWYQKLLGINSRPFLSIPWTDGRLPPLTVTPSLASKMQKGRTTQSKI